MSVVATAFACEQANNGRLVNDGVSFTTVIYGAYAQDRVTDDALISALDGLGVSSWQDGRAAYGNNVYEKLTASPYSEFAKFDDGAAIEKGKTYYFTVMPVEWYVLGTDAESTKLVSSKILDVQVFNSNVDRSPDNDGNYVNNWENSTLRAWLNGTFFNRTFTSYEKAAISETKNSSAYPESYYKNHSAAIKDTWDRVYCLSYADTVNKDGRYSYRYSFSKDMVDYDCLRMAKVTDYAKARGAWYYIATAKEDYKNYEVDRILDGNGKYWLRTVGKDSVYAAVVRYTGEVGRTYENVGYKYAGSARSTIDVGVRPAVTVGFDATVGK